MTPKWRKGIFTLLTALSPLVCGSVSRASVKELDAAAVQKLLRQEPAKVRLGSVFSLWPALHIRAFRADGS